MLDFKPEARPSANDALTHSWFLAESHVITPALQQHFRTVLGKHEGMKQTLEQEEKEKQETGERIFTNLVRSLTLKFQHD